MAEIRRPSRAALQRARDLSNATTEQWFEGVLLQPPLLAFARHIALVSDLAAYVSQYVDNGAAPPEALRQQLQELILPAEPCPHWLNVREYVSLPADGPAHRCGQCGKALKIVEAGDD